MSNWSSKETKSQFQYIRLADTLEKRILKGEYKIGEKLPSLRKLHNQLGLSKTTIFYTYIELEKRGLVESRPRSGYFVKALISPRFSRLSSAGNALAPQKSANLNLSNSIVDALSNPELLHFGGITISPTLLPLNAFSRSLKSISSNHIDHIISTPGKPEGNLELRQQIAKRILEDDRIEADDIIITNRCMEALNLCLRAVAKRGDTIAVESPVFFESLSLIENLGMQALEIPTHPQTGIDLDNLEAVLSQRAVQACMVIPNFQNPLGALMPVSNKKRLVEMLGERRIPIIENDISGDLYFGETRPPTLKSFDTKGLVLYCSSFSKTLAPGLRGGWTVPGKFRESIIELKVNLSFYPSNLDQMLIAEFLESGSYDRHLKRLRNALKQQMENLNSAVVRHFPRETKINRPQGGMVLWIELKPTIDGLEIYQAALREKISIIPGCVFSHSQKFQNFIRLNYGDPWTEKLEQGISTLGTILAQFT
ncbi:MAG: PLP-dependent aminotransferase family protein [SAR324 cluster bacterium]|nr:PLP-dependent aminotransferase family protein [SAR324 cluster bacterium]